MKRYVFLVLTFFSGLAAAHDGYQDLQRPDGLGSCCSNGDCGPTETRIAPDGHLQALIDPQNAPNWGEWAIEGHIPKTPFWMDVPESAFLPAEQNPKAGPSICFIPAKVLCFLPGRGM